MKERTMQQALADAINNSAEWPSVAPVIVALPGDIETQIQTAIGKTGMCAIVGEPDKLHSVYGDSSFNESSEWTIGVFTSELMNTTGLDNFSAALLIRRLLGESNPQGLWAEPLSRFQLRFLGMENGIVARDVVFTSAYQS